MTNNQTISDVKAGSFIITNATAAVNTTYIIIDDSILTT
jgi:hypothetical protein